jgi:hypothetical protein
LCILCKRQFNQLFLTQFTQVVLGHRDPILSNLLNFEEGVSSYGSIIEYLFYFVKEKHWHWSTQGFLRVGNI